MTASIKKFAGACMAIVMHLVNLPEGIAQYGQHNTISFEDYAGEIMSAEENSLVFLEEWQTMVGQWLERPLCINSAEAEMLMEYKIISLFQLNKLKEYRYIYSNLLSVYELSFIDGWDVQTVRKVIPLVTTVVPETEREPSRFIYKSFHHNLVIKTAFNAYKSKAYEEFPIRENTSASSYYTGPASRMAIRYDLEYKKKFALGIRTEKDPGEPYFISNNYFGMNIKQPDLLSGYMLAKDLGLVKMVILGNYRVDFGYGINVSGGQSLIRNRSGISGMAHRIRPQTSVGESGYYRGIALSAGRGRWAVSAFLSSQRLDGTSIEYDSLSGQAVSFSSVNISGLHRTENELINRKVISEKVAGGFIVFRNNWLKTGLIAMYNHFNADIKVSDNAYDRFDLSGRENLVAGWSATAWLPGIQLFAESSISKNKGLAVISGLQLSPVPGCLLVLAHRHFSIHYQNWNGSGYISSGRNSGESGLEARLKLELPGKWLIEFGTDLSKAHWVSYSLDAPSKRQEVRFMAEKNWTATRSFTFSFRYLQEDTKSDVLSNWICHPSNQSQYRFRAEARIDAAGAVKLKSRVEYTFKTNEKPGFLMLQDIEIPATHQMIKWWLRICFFDANSFTNSIYAYENDVMYDFTTFLHYGKGLRGLIMMSAKFSRWLDMWVRISTVYYTNKRAGSGWDEIEGKRQIEAEVQARFRFSH